MCDSNQSPEEFLREILTGYPVDAPFPNEGKPQLSAIRSTLPQNQNAATQHSSRVSDIEGHFSNAVAAQDADETFPYPSLDFYNDQTQNSHAAAFPDVDPNRGLQQPPVWYIKETATWRQMFTVMENRLDDVTKYFFVNMKSYDTLTVIRQMDDMRTYYRRLLPWTIDTNRLFSNLAAQVVEIRDRIAWIFEAETLRGDDRAER